MIDVPNNTCQMIGYCTRLLAIQPLEKFPLKELEPKLANLAEVLIKEGPPPGQVLKAISAVLSGGFPFDNTRDFK